MLSQAILDDRRADALVRALAESAKEFSPSISAAHDVDCFCRVVSNEFHKHLGDEARGLDQIPERIRASGLVPGEVLREILTRGADAVAGLAGRLGVDPSVFAVFATYWVRPFVRLAATTGAHTDTPATPATCPTCGAPPSLSKLRHEDGARLLWCAMCDTDWRVARLACPFCENNDAASLDFFEVEGEPRLHVDTCARCRRYIKVIDERRVEERPVSYDSFLWSSALYDILAEKRGLKTTSQEAL
jgi:hypothetical protein